MKNKNLLTIESLSKEEILEILEDTSNIKKDNSDEKLLKNHILASCFFEPSTRTRFSFESAMYRLGGNVLSLSDKEVCSMEKGETLFDTVKVLGSYADIIVLRHPLEGAAKRASEATDKPVINAGDGTQEHPSQTLIDLFSIQESQGKLENLNIAIIGDLLHGRTVHSLVLAFQNFYNRLFFISPEELSLPKSLVSKLKAKGIPFSFNNRLEDIIKDLDIIYITRVQKERFHSNYDHLRTQTCYSLSADRLKNCKPNLKILHPLPRIDEIHTDIDATSNAYYFTQASNGLYLRQVLLAKLLGKL